jgi:hypothetical protein
VLRQVGVELGGPGGPVDDRALPALEVLELVAGRVAVVHRAGGNRVEPGPKGHAGFGGLAGEPVGGPPEVLGAHER